MKLYMHTIEGCPAEYYPKQQICYATNRGVWRFCSSYAKIRYERKKSVTYRIKNGFPIPNYGYIVLHVPEVQ